MLINALKILGLEKQPWNSAIFWDMFLKYIRNMYGCDYRAVQQQTTPFFAVFHCLCSNFSRTGTRRTVQNFKIGCKAYKCCLEKLAQALVLFFTLSGTNRTTNVGTDQCPLLYAPVRLSQKNFFWGAGITRKKLSG